MDQIDTTCEHIRLRLIAAAVGLQQCTKTAANMIPLPGTERFVAIGTPAEVRRLLTDRAPAFDFYAHLARQAAWSEHTFGPGSRTKGVCDHIRKELLEIEADPLDLREWIDVVILALDGAWRCGGTPEQIIAGIVAKQAKNEGRTWPDWRTADPDKAIEHDRSQEGATS